MLHINLCIFEITYEDETIYNMSAYQLPRYY